MSKITWIGLSLVVVGLVLGGALAFGVHQAEASARAQMTPDAISPLTPPSPITLQAEPGDPQRGAPLYDHACAGCHGTLGNSDRPLHGPLLNVYYPNDGVLAAIIRQGYGTMPATDEHDLSDQDVADVISFIRTFP